MNLLLALLDVEQGVPAVHSTLPLSVAVLVSFGIVVIGLLYIAAPKKIAAGFGLRPPAPDRDTLAWLRLKGIRDVVSGVAVLTLMLTTNSRTVGIVLLVFALTPFGDMSNVLASGGSRATAFSVHGLTCAAMAFAGLLLVHVL